MVVTASIGLLNREIRGRITIGELHNLTLRKLVVRNVRVRDPDGRVVIRAQRVALTPDWAALGRGVIRVARARLRRGEVILYAREAPDALTLIETFEPAHPGPPGQPATPPPPIVFDDIVLDDVRVHGNVPHFAGLDLTHVRANARISTQRSGDETSVLFQVFDGRAELVGPFDDVIHIDRIVGRMSTDLRQGLNAYVRARHGRDRLRARIALQEPDRTQPKWMRLRASAEPVSVETLRGLGLFEIDPLMGQMRGTAVLEGPTDQLRLRGDLQTSGGPVRVAADLPAAGTLSIRAASPGLHVHRLVRLPVPLPIETAGRVELQLIPVDPERRERRVSLRLDPLHLGDLAVVAADLHGVLRDDRLEIESAEATRPGTELSAEGYVAYDGSLSLRTRAHIPRLSRDPDLRRALPGGRGGLLAQIQLSAGPGGEDLRMNGRASASRFRYGNLSADRWNVQGRASFDSPEPRASLRADAEGLRVAGVRLGQARASVRGGGGGGYALTFESAQSGRGRRIGRRIALSGRAHLDARGTHIDLPAVRLDSPRGAFRGTLAGLDIQQGRVRIERLALRRGDETLSLAGSVRGSGRADLSVDVRGLDVRELAALGDRPLEEIGGRLSGQARLHGNLNRKPELVVEGQLTEGRLGPLRGAEGDFALALREGKLDTLASLDLGPQGRLRIEGPIEIGHDGLPDPARIVREGSLSGLRVTSRSLDIAPLLSLFGSRVDLRGRLTTDATLDGPLEDPLVQQAAVVIDRWAFGEMEPLRAKLRFGYRDHNLEIHRFWVADRHGELASGEARLPLRLDALPRSLRELYDAVSREAFTLALRVAPRRLDSWPSPLAERLPSGLVFAGNLFARQGRTGPEAALRAHARYVDPATKAACARQLRPTFQLSAELANERATADLRARFEGASFDGGRAELIGRASAAIPLDAWVADGVSAMPSTDARLSVKNASMASIPWLCEYGSSRIDGRARARGLFTDAPQIALRADLPNLRVWQDAASRGTTRLSRRHRLHARLATGAEPGRAEACAILGRSDRLGTPASACTTATTPRPGELIAQAQLPLAWTPAELTPSLDPAQSAAVDVQLSRVNIEPLLRFIPGMVGGQVEVDGEVHARGPVQAPRLSGELDIANGHLAIEGLGQHLHDIDGRVEFRGDHLLLPADRPLMARDAGGSARIQGRINLAGWLPSSLEMNAELGSFPVRREGSVLAQLSGRARIRGDIDPSRIESRVRTRAFAVSLPQQSAATLQAMDPHRDILVVGRPRPDARQGADGAYPVQIRLDAREPFWVRRSDFAVQVSANLRAAYEDPTLRVGGVANILRGTFEIFGKRFELRPGALTFDALAPELDPQVNLTAVYDIPGRRGATVTVRVTGSLVAPRVTFTSTESNDQAEIIAILITGARREVGTAEQDVTEEAASFLVGLTAGILTLGLRQEFGDVIPVLAIETPTAGQTRIRAGFNARELIPDFLRDVVTGMYIEGFFTNTIDTGGLAASSGQSSGSAGLGGGVTVELNFPYSIVVRGTYVPVNTGSLDFLLEL